MITIKAGISSTHGTIEFFDKYKNAFGNVAKAEMVSDSVLILTNDKNETMNIKGTVTTGYIGEGPKGTYKILKMCGFDIDQNFILTNNKFKLEK